MKSYAIFTNDLPHTRWLLSDQISKKDFFSFRPKPRFEKLVCAKCFQADHDAIFARGFDTTEDFKSKRDLLETTDGLLCLSEKVKPLLLRHRVGGFKVKPVGHDGWWVVNPTLRVNAIRVYRTGIEDGRRLCPKCKRALTMGNVYEFERQISLPKQSRTFFTVVHERQGTHMGRDIFVTEEVVHIFQDAGIKGCSFRKLLNMEEERQYKQSIKAGNERWPPGCFVNL